MALPTTPTLSLSLPPSLLPKFSLEAKLCDGQTQPPSHLPSSLWATNLSFQPNSPQPAKSTNKPLLKVGIPDSLSPGFSLSPLFAPLLLLLLLCGPDLQADQLMPYSYYLALAFLAATAMCSFSGMKWFVASPPRPAPSSPWDQHLLLLHADGKKAKKERAIARRKKQLFSLDP